MKEPVQLEECAKRIYEALPKGILLNTNGDKFNSMVIGWGNLGATWGVPTFVAYVRESRYTKAQIDKTGEFTISIPLEAPIPKIAKVCGSMSGRDVDKVKEAGLTLEEPGANHHTPGVKEYPLTLECQVLYSQEQDAGGIPADIRKAFYPAGADGKPDLHTAYIARILRAYVIR
ncbi:MAG: flavin reductase [Oscillibacter sp.]|nr:flavin reductase [Oscillibacter sp.]